MCLLSDEEKKRSETTNKPLLVYIQFEKSLRLAGVNQGWVGIIMHERNAQDHGYCFDHLQSLAFPIGSGRFADREKR